MAAAAAQAQHGCNCSVAAAHPGNRASKQTQLAGAAQVRLNFPNGDMVGHTGDLKATITACTAVDKAVTVRMSDKAHPQ
jgi:bisphosphoglycerate-independent phosphoglycerate mutase (AlkP superfamily)